MKFKDKYNIATEFESLFSFKSKEEELEHEAKMIMFRFISELEKINAGNPIKKKELAKAIKTSASFVTQFYQGDKLVNLLTLAKIQDAYNITFEIKAKHNSQNYKEGVENTYKDLTTKNQWIDEKGYWRHISKHPYNKKGNVEPHTQKNTIKIA